MIILLLCLIVLENKFLSAEEKVEWCEVKSPTTKDLYSVFALSKNDVWAVGDSGVIIHWNGNEWNLVKSPTSRRLNAVRFIAPNNGWAVGVSGVLLNYSTDWVEVESPVFMRLYDVEFTSPKDGWAVGGVGKILHFNGNKWSEVMSPTDKSILDCYFLKTEGWAASHYILYYNKKKGWKEDVNLTVSSIWFISSKEGWSINNKPTVSDIKGTLNTIYHFINDCWEKSAVITLYGEESVLDKLYFISPNNGYAIGAKVYHYDGEKWEKQSDISLNSISFVDENEGWGVCSEGKIYHYTKKDK